MLPYILVFILFYIRIVNGNGLDRICKICDGVSTEVLFLSGEKCFMPDQNIFVWPRFTDSDIQACTFPTFLSGASKRIRLDAESFGVTVRRKDCQDLILPFKVLCKQTNVWSFGTLKVKVITIFTELKFPKKPFLDCFT